MQFQVRKKLLDLLTSWQKGKGGRNFAFVHLFLNLKDRAEAARVPSEYIPGIARIRTDLDQFGCIEREALMYHGYTLIHAQISRHCPELLNGRGPELKRPPLFTDYPAVGEAGGKDGREGRFLQRRERIQKVLEIGSQKLFLLRSFQKYPAKAGVVILLTWLIPLLVLYWVDVNPRLDWLTEKVGVPVIGWLQGMLPGWLTWIFTEFVGFLQWPITPEGVTVVVAFLFLGYVLGFATYLTMRRFVRRWDLNQYTGH